MTDVSKAIDDFLSLPPADPRLVPTAEKLVESVRAFMDDNADLREYRHLKEELGTKPDYFIAPPNFPYVVHSA